MECKRVHSKLPAHVQEKVEQAFENVRRSFLRRRMREGGPPVSEATMTKFFVEGIEGLAEIVTKPRP